MLKAIEIDGKRIPAEQIYSLEMNSGEVKMEIYHDRNVITKIRKYNEVRFIDSCEEKERAE